MAATTETDAAGPSPASRSLDFNQVVQGVGAVIAPTALLSAIAFYFGWTRIAAYDAYFGLTPGQIGYSTRDYILLSLDPLFLPVATVLVILIARAFARGYALHSYEQGLSRQTLVRLNDAATILGTFLFVFGAVAAFGGLPFSTSYLVGSLFPALGVLLVSDAVADRRRMHGRSPLSMSTHVLVGLFVALSLFWAAGLDADSIGRSEARDLAAHLDRLPGAVIDSHDGLSILATSASGIEIAEVNHGYYPYEYRGLRLFADKNGVLFLIPRGWGHDNGVPLLDLPLTDNLRFTVTPGAESATTSLVAAAAGGAHMPISVGHAAPIPPVHRTNPRRLTIVEAPNSQSVAVGGTATFTITVRNTGRVRLTGVSVDDPRSRRCNRNLGTLAAGTTRTYICSRINVRKKYENVTTADGNAREPLIYQATDRATVTVHP